MYHGSLLSGETMSMSSGPTYSLGRLASPALAMLFCIDTRYDMISVQGFGHANRAEALQTCPEFKWPRQFKTPNAHD